MKEKEAAKKEFDEQMAELCSTLEKYKVNHCPSLFVYKLKYNCMITNYI